MLTSLPQCQWFCTLQRKGKGRPTAPHSFTQACVLNRCLVDQLCYRFELSDPKVRIVDDVAANDRDGLSTRFRACLLAKQPWVLIQDDDHYLQVRTLDACWWWAGQEALLLPVN